MLPYVQYSLVPRPLSAFYTCKITHTHLKEEEPGDEAMFNRPYTHCLSWDVTVHRTTYIEIVVIVQGLLNFVLNDAFNPIK